MLIDRWMTQDPWKAMDQMFNQVFAAPPARARRRVGPKVHLRDDGEAFELTAPLPGVKDEDVELTAGDDFITLVAKRDTTLPEGYRVERREREDLGFERTYKLPDRIDTSKVEAKLGNGVLSVTLPKRAEAKTRTIAVKAA